VVVVVTRKVRNPRFGKFELKRAKYKAHSSDNGVHVGDKVLLCESRPLSRDKRWRVEKLIEKARQA
jgi:small subunit ribosomal protein S17